jgi:hypothetical protein
VSAPRLGLYAIFHLNLAYSSIEVEQRRVVIDRCYRPLLALAREHAFVPGIELSGHTLELAAELAPDWVEELRDLLAKGRCELVGSGYSQLIGPLVPAEVNAANQRLGVEEYAARLGTRPAIALVNEQAYSGGLIEHYLDAGYRAIAMEWNNPAAQHAEWPEALRFSPQRALGSNGRSIELLWIDTIAFQQLQRFAHGDLELAEHLAYLDRQRAAAPAEGVFPLYGNDAEVFDFRPGRFSTETAPAAGGEWRRIGELLAALATDPRFELLAPSRALERSRPADLLELESPAEPVSVKKQAKYNLTRWAVTGRDSLQINSECWRLYRSLRAASPPRDADLRTLCRLWGSDFRTHITSARWQAYRAELAAALRDLPRTPVVRAVAPAGDGGGSVERRGRLLEVRTDAVHAVLDCRRGLAIRSLAFPAVADVPLVGTIPHGHYDDLALAADYYTGHTVVQLPGASQLTDLEVVAPHWQRFASADGRGVRIVAEIATPLGRITKEIDVYQGAPRLALRCSFDWEQPRRGTFRTGFVTVLPGAFERTRLFYRTHIGGARVETFALDGAHVSHPTAVSPLVSARGGLGATEGWIAIGDARRRITVHFDPAETAALPMLDYRDVGAGYWLRLLFSLGELDETRNLRDAPEKLPAPDFAFAITGERA